MKLRTNLIVNVMLGNKVFPAGTDGDIEHDAFAAHALMQAIAEWWNRPIDDSCTGAVAWIEQRANELMREWGYADDDARK